MCMYMSMLSPATALFTSIAVVIVTLLYLWQTALSDAAALSIALALARDELAQLRAAEPPVPPPPQPTASPPPPPVAGCQTVCDRECSRFDNCKGEAWVRVNLFELLQSDTGPVPLFSQCYSPLAPSLRRGIRTLLLQSVAMAAGVDESELRGDVSLQDYARHIDAPTSLAFQRDAEALTHQQQPTRRVRHDALRRAALKGWKLNKLHRVLTDYGCQPKGLSLPHLARTRFFNESHKSFRVANLHQDAVLFMLDMVIQERALFDRLTWLGVGVEQDPFDAFVLQRLITQLRPDMIIETGTFNGGGALFLASILALVHPAGKVHTIDPWKRRFHKSYAKWDAPARRLFDAHVTYHPNSSVDAPVVEMIRTAAAAVKGPVLVVLDSNHAASFVTKELEAYAPMVTVGSYLVVEDMKLDRMLHGIDAKEDGAKQWAGPTPAVQAFLKANRQFRADRGVESLWYTQHPAGFLKRTR